jgi:hypothetical protein
MIFLDPLAYLRDILGTSRPATIPVVLISHKIYKSLYLTYHNKVDAARGGPFPAMLAGNAGRMNDGFPRRGLVAPRRNVALH